MNIVFMYFGDEQYHWVNPFLESVRENVPNAKIYQFSGNAEEKLIGVDEIVRFNVNKDNDRGSLGRLVINALVESPISEFVRLDADMIVSGDINEVMDGDFDIAITKRVKDGTVSEAFAEQHPYNGGFVVTKNLAFWKKVKEVMDGLTFEKDNELHITKPYFEFLVGQLALCRVIDSREFKVKFLDAEIYNKSPKNKDEKNNFTKVWHFKGNRKYWMVDK